MPSNLEVAIALAPEKEWRTAYPFIEAAAKAILENLTPPHLVLSTTQLADEIYSPAQAHDTRVRKRVFQALKALATRGLAPYITLGEPEQIAGMESGRRKLWHAPSAVPKHKTCHVCGGPLP